MRSAGARSAGSADPSEQGSGKKEVEGVRRAEAPESAASKEPVPPPTPRPRAVAPAAPTAEYVVQPGDTLAGIAARLLGDESRWREVFEANRGVARLDDRRVLSNPNIIWPGLRLQLPGGDAASAPRPDPAPALSGRAEATSPPGPEGAEGPGAAAVSGVSVQAPGPAQGERASGAPDADPDASETAAEALDMELASPTAPGAGTSGTAAGGPGGQSASALGSSDPYLELKDVMEKLATISAGQAGQQQAQLPNRADDLPSALTARPVTLGGAVAKGALESLGSPKDWAKRRLPAWHPRRARPTKDEGEQG